MDIVLRAVQFASLVPDQGRGRRELSTIQPFDLLLIVLGDLIKKGVTQKDFSSREFFAWDDSVMTVFSLARLRFRFGRPILEGTR